MISQIKSILSKLAPLAVVVGGVGFAALIVATGPKLEPQPAASSAPLVRTWQANE